VLHDLGAAVVEDEQVEAGFDEEDCSRGADDSVSAGGSGTSA
jgi:hypothetical protein